MGKRLILGLLAACVFVALVWGGLKGAHLLTCLDSEREGCPNWCWTCNDPAPCEAHGGVRDISAPFLGFREYICKDGTTE